MNRLRVSRSVLVLAFLCAWATGIIVASQRAASERAASGMAAAASRFLDGLSAEQRQQATFPIDSEELTRWHFIPTNTFPRKGVPLKAMTEPQRVLAKDLLRAGLSQSGYLTATGIIDLETILKAIETTGTNTRDPELYYFSVFGTPAPKGAWGWRVEGHHLSLHFVVAGGSAIAATPAFFGSNPAEVRVDGPQKGLRVLGAREDAARALLMALDETQRTTATFAEAAPNDIVTMTTLKVDPVSPAGLAASAMQPGQRDLLMKLVEVYTGTMTEDVASERMARIREAGLEKISFAWAGPVERGQRHYYRAQGPTFLIEYDNSQNNGNHVHSVWRDFNGDFGRDLLREHVKSVVH